MQRIEQALGEVGELGAFVANLSSMATLAVAGAVLNLVVGHYYGFEGLGAFSQALLFFLVLGQVSAGGFAFAALYRLSLRDTAPSQVRGYFVAMCLPVALIGGLQAWLMWHGGAWVGALLGSEALAEILPAVGLGAWLFGLNKVGASALNGLSHLKTYALVQGLRMPLMLLALLWLVWRDAALTAMGWLFVASEALIALSFALGLPRLLPPGPVSLAQIWRILSVDGARCWRGSLIGLASDLNTKVDLLVLSLLASDTVVGIYALGGMFADGLRMVHAAVQNLVNPRVAGLITSGQRAAFDALFHDLTRLGPALSALVLAGGALVMVTVAPAVFGAEDTETSLWVFLVVGASLLLASPAIILNNCFTQNGQPGLQTAYFAVVAAINLVLNLLLIPPYGPLGAAIATAVAELAQLFLLRRWVAGLYARR